MDDHRSPLLSVLGDVLQVELLGQMEVDLDGRDRLFAAEDVADLDVELRPVERRLAGRLGEWQAQRLHRLAEHPLAHLPHGVVLDVLLAVVRVAQRQTIPVVSDAEGRVGALDQAHHVRELLLHLVRRAEDVRVVQRHGADAAEPADDARLLVTVHGAELRDAHRQVTVAPELRRVDEDMVRAVHGPEDHLLMVEVHRREHAVAIVLPVPGDFVQVALGDVRRVDMLIARLALLPQDVLLEDSANRGAFGEPQGQSCADELVRREQLQLAAEPPVVAPFRLCEARFVVA